MQSTQKIFASQFKQPVRQIFTMLVVLALVAVGGTLIFPAVKPVFLANPYLNGFILVVFFFGVCACFWQVIQLTSSVSWIQSFADNAPGHESARVPQLLASLAALLRERGTRMQINTSSARTILDSVAIRMDESRDITRYIINLLIFLGLLGTFYGLATTIPGVVDTIRSLNLSDGENGAAVVGQLLDGLEGQLAGMGTAFASSLLGLAGSLVVGLLELFAGHGQNRFYREMEEWLSTITRVGFATGDAEGGGFDQSVVATVLDHMVEQIDSLQGLFRKAEHSRLETEEKIDVLTGAMLRMTERLESAVDPTDVLVQIAENQERMNDTLSQQKVASAPQTQEADPEAKMRLRSIDVQLLKVLEEMSAGRTENATQIHDGLARLTRAVENLHNNTREIQGE